MGHMRTFGLFGFEMNLKELIKLLKGELRQHGNVDVGGNWAVTTAGGTPDKWGFGAPYTIEINCFAGKKETVDPVARDNILTLQHEVAALRCEVNWLKTEIGKHLTSVHITADDSGFKAELERYRREVFNSRNSYWGIKDCIDWDQKARTQWVSVRDALPDPFIRVMVKACNLPYGWGIGVHRNCVWHVSDMDGKTYTDSCSKYGIAVQEWRYLPEL